MTRSSVLNMNEPYSSFRIGNGLLKRNIEQMELKYNLLLNFILFCGVKQYVFQSL